MIEFIKNKIKLAYLNSPLLRKLRKETLRNANERRFKGTSVIQLDEKVPLPLIFVKQTNRINLVTSCLATNEELVKVIPQIQIATHLSNALKFPLRIITTQTSVRPDLLFKLFRDHQFHPESSLSFFDVSHRFYISFPKLEVSENDIFLTTNQSSLILAKEANLHPKGLFHIAETPPIPLDETVKYYRIENNKYSLEEIKAIAQTIQSLLSSSS